MGKFKKGLFFGGIIGAGITWLNSTKKGKQVRDEMLDHAADVYEKLLEDVKQTDKWKELSEHEYTQKVSEFVDRYAVDTGISDKAKKMVQTLVVDQWDRFQGEEE